MPPRPSPKPAAPADEAFDWMSEIGFVAPTPVGRDIRGRRIDFYPIRLDMMCKLKPVVKSILSPLSDMLTERNKIVAVTQKQNVDKDGSTYMETASTAMSPDMLEFVTDSSRAAVERLVESLLDEKNKLIFGQLIADSARDVFVEDKVTTANLQAFVSSMDLQLAVEFFGGWLAANKKVFLDAIPAEMRAKAARIGIALTSVQPNEAEKEASPSA